VHLTKDSTVPSLPKLLGACLATLVAAVFSMPAIARTAAGVTADWPDRPIRMVTPWSPGSGTDIVARMVADRLREITDKLDRALNRIAAMPDVQARIREAGSFPVTPAITPKQWGEMFRRDVKTWAGLVTRSGPTIN